MYCLLLACVFLLNASCAIPEPGLILYGAISASRIPASVEWQVSSTSSAVSINSTLVNVNGQNYYLALIPFETRSVGSVPLGTPTPNALPLNSTPTTYTRHATVNGTNAAIGDGSSGNSDTFTFGPADRGRVERVDLALSPPPTFTNWLAQYNLPINSDPNFVSTNKGMTLMQQYLAGLDPNNTKSMFQIIGILPTQQSVQIQWASAAGIVYALEQGNSVSGPFSVLQSNIVATPGMNQFDVPATGVATNLFFRITVQEGQ